MFYLDLIIAILMAVGIVRTAKLQGGMVNLIVFILVSLLTINGLYLIGLTLSSVVALAGVAVNLMYALDILGKRVKEEG